MSIGARITKIAKGLSAKDAADAFVRASSEPMSLSPAQQAKAEEFEATVEAMFLMAVVDGEMADDEAAQLAASIDAIAETAQGAKARVDASALLARLNDKLGAEGWNKRLAAVAAKLTHREARAFAFRLAAGVAFVDDHVAHAEAAALEAFASALALTPDESQELLYDVRDTLFG